MIDKKDLEIKEDPVLEQVFQNLAQCELEMDKADKKVELYRIQVTQPVYEKRAKLFLDIPNLWYIILAQHEDFQEYLQTEDMKYLEYIDEITVTYLEKSPFDTLDDETPSLEDPAKFSITFGFKSDDNEMVTQKVTKYFHKVNDPETGESKVVSKPVPEFQWPKSYDNINPIKLKESVGGNVAKFTAAQKKSYRQGMKSFFAFFNWTGEKPGKEYRSGEELALLIAEDIYPFATKYYTEAMTALEEDEDDELGSSSDALDISDDDEEEGDSAVEPLKKKQKK